MTIGDIVGDIPTAFVDTGAFFALSVKRDRHHQEAAAIFDALGRSRVHLVTTNFIIAETHALVLARAGRDLAAATLDLIDRSPIVVIRISEEDELHAREIVSRYRDKEFSLTDAMSFAVMERVGINHAVAFDHHFRQFGFQMVSPDR